MGDHVKGFDDLNTLHFLLLFCRGWYGVRVVTVDALFNGVKVVLKMSNEKERKYGIVAETPPHARSAPLRP